MAVGGRGVGVGGIWVGTGDGGSVGSSVGWVTISVAWGCIVGVEDGAGVTVGSIGAGVRVSVAVDREMEDVPRAGCNVGVGGSPRTSRATPGMFCTASTAAIAAVTRQITMNAAIAISQYFRVVMIHSFLGRDAAFDRLDSKRVGRDRPTARDLCLQADAERSEQRLYHGRCRGATYCQPMAVASASFQLDSCILWPLHV